MGNPLEQPTIGHKPEYTSDNTAFMRWYAEVEEKPNVTDQDFMRRNKLRIFNTDKFPALAFYKNPKMIKLRALRNIEITLAHNLGLEDTAEELVFDNIDNVQVTRGTDGNFTKALQTQRFEWKEENPQVREKVGRLSRWFGGQKQQDNQQQEMIQQ